MATMIEGNVMDIKENSDRLTEIYRAGRRTGIGIAALAIGITTYLSLLGAEKAVLAVVLGVLALRGEPHGTLARRLGIASVVLGSVFIVTIPVLLVVFWDRVAEFVSILSKLS